LREEDAPLVKQVLYRALADPDYASNVFGKIPCTEEMYGDYKQVAIEIRNHYRKYSDPMSVSALQTALINFLKRGRKDNSDNVDTFMEQAKEVSSYSQRENYANDQEIKDQIDSWSRNQMATSVLVRELSKSPDVGSPEVIQRIMSGLNDAMSAGSMSGVTGWVSLFDENDIDNVVSSMKDVRSKTIPFGWQHLDTMLGGGLAAGELGLIIAPFGRGKSNFMINVAKRYAVNSRKNVLYVALEEKVGRLATREFRMVSNQGMSDIKDSEGNINEAKIKLQLKAFYEAKKQGLIGDLDIVTSNPQTISPAGIEKIIQQYALKRGHYPDALFIDYPELMENPFLKEGINEFRAVGMLYEAIRRIAGQYNMVTWVASQTNRTVVDQEIANAYSIEGSKQKLNTVELSLTMNQNQDEFDNGYMRLYIDKIRNPETTVDRMLYFCVDKKSVSIREENESEHEAHLQLLQKGKSSKFGDYEKEGLSKKDLDEKRKKANDFIESWQSKG